MKEQLLKVRSMLFPIFAALMLAGPAALFCAQRIAHIELPGWLTAEDAVYLSGGRTEVNVRAEATLDGFRESAFQEALETEIGNYIPAKASALLANAALQRCAIAASNSLFGWECYPTYFDSDILCIPAIDSLTATPRSKDADVEGDWRRFAAGVREVAVRYPDKRFVLYVVGAYSEPAYSPAYLLTSNPRVPDDCCDILHEETKDLTNVYVITNHYESDSEYYEEFFRTDHHWNIRGAFRAYETIAETLGLETVSMDGVRNIPEYGFSGSRARSGLDLIEEDVFDCCNSFSDLDIYDGEVLIGTCADHDAFFDSPSLYRRCYFYGLYYNNIGDFSITGGSGDRRALLVGNSFKGAIQRPLASSYSYLALSNQLHPSSEVVPTLAEQIENSRADDIIFVANPGNYRKPESFFM